MPQKPKIFVDGQEGTTGLEIHQYLAARGDITLLGIAPERRKETAARAEILNAADVAILCLPDAASREAVALLGSGNTRVIDASTAFRTDPEWAYGLPELSAGQRARIREAKRVAVPGCHASAFLLAVAPLTAAGILKADSPLAAFSVTGYSGGGKKMIAAYEPVDGAMPEKLKSPRHYALSLGHKHLPEMQAVAGLSQPPLFTPVVCNTYRGLAVEVFLPSSFIDVARLADGGSPLRSVHEFLSRHYAGEPFVRVMPLEPDGSPTGLDEGQFDMTGCNRTNRADIFVLGNDKQMALVARLDNLGKGAAGAAVQCLNLMLGVDEGTGLKAGVTAGER